MRRPRRRREQLKAHFAAPNRELYAQLAEDRRTAAAPPEERPFEPFLTKECDPCVGMKGGGALASARAALASSKAEVKRLNKALRDAAAQVRTSSQAVRRLGGFKPQKSPPRQSVAFIVNCTSECTTPGSV